MTGGGLATAAVILFACAVATIPGEWQEDHLPPLAFIPTKQGVIPLHVWIAGLFPNYLILPEFSLYEAQKIDDPQKVASKKYLIDLKGRDLQGALLTRAILTRANLRGAKLQGALLMEAQLQGADLTGAQLQGALLDVSELQGATLAGAQFQGSSLNFAHLQGADLAGAQLQGVSLVYAQLEGALLYGAQLQGAALDLSELQGAVLEDAQLQGASLLQTWLWRATLGQVIAKDLFAPAGSPNWSPIGPASMTLNAGRHIITRHQEAWTDATYAELRQSIERALPEGRQRSDALERVAVLDCGLKGDIFASCDPSSERPAEVNKWIEIIRAASVDKRAYNRALAKILGDLVCSNEPYRLDVLQRLLFADMLRRTGDEAPALSKRITSAECPVSKTFTASYKADFPQIVQREQ